MDRKRGQFLRFLTGKTFWMLLLFLVIFFHFLLFYPRPLHEFPVEKDVELHMPSGTSLATDTGNATSPDHGGRGSK